MDDKTSKKACCFLFVITAICCISVIICSIIGILFLSGGILIRAFLFFIICVLLVPTSMFVYEEIYEPITREEERQKRM